MSRRVYLIQGGAVTLATGAVLGYGVASRMPLLVVLSFLLGWIAVTALRSRVSEVVEDELVLRVSERASRRAMQLFVLTGAALGALLISTGNASTGSLLLVVSSALLLAYLGLVCYYTWKGVEY